MERDNLSFLEMAEDILAAAESGDMSVVEERKNKFTEAGGQLYRDLIGQGFSEEDILSGAYLSDPRYAIIGLIIFYF